MSAKEKLLKLLLHRKKIMQKSSNKTKKSSGMQTAYVQIILLPYLSVILGLSIRVHNKKTNQFFLKLNLGCGYSKEKSQWDGSFEYPKHILNRWVEKYSQFYTQKCVCLDLWPIWDKVSKVQSQKNKQLSRGKNISILHLSCRMSDLQFSLVLQTHALVL